MRNFPVSVLNSIGFKSAEQKAYFAAHVLRAATLGGEKVVFQKAVAANPRANPPVLALPEISSPKCVPIPGWHDAIQIQRTASTIQIVAHLPQETTPALIGYATDGLNAVMQISDPKLQVTIWKDTKVSDFPESLATEEDTLEKFFVKYAKQCPNCQVESTIYQVGLRVIPVQKFTIAIPVTGYDPSNHSLQLNKLPGGSGGFEPT